jgi:hypothetical protein
MTDPDLDTKRREREGRTVDSPLPARRLGVMGTMVWDRVFSQGEASPTESWGGLSYALEAFGASLPGNWEVVPIVRVGRDRVESAREYLGGMERVGKLSGVLESPFDAVTVERRYFDGWRRQERILGAERPWTQEELSPLFSELDALYLNFITGFEMDLETARSLKTVWPFPLYADLHSLFLDKDEDGRRSIRTIPRWREWVGAFDMVQMNEEEFGTLARSPEAARAEVESLMGSDLKLLAVTLGADGADYTSTEGFNPDPERWRDDRRADFGGGGILKGRVPLGNEPFSGDPSGCGDVWGATFLSRLLAGDRLETAVAEANRGASRKIGFQGAPGLRHHLSA